MAETMSSDETRRLSGELRSQETALWRRLLSPGNKTRTLEALPPEAQAHVGDWCAWGVGQAQDGPIPILLDEDLGRLWLRAAVALFPRLDPQLRGIRRCRDRIIEGNINLVYKLARKMKRQRYGKCEFDDLVQNGHLGLIRATEMFDSRLGWKFSTYACNWIVHCMVRGVQSEPMPARLPVHVHTRMQAIRDLTRELTASLGREPTGEEVDAVAVKRKSRAIMGKTTPLDSKVIRRQMRDARVAFGAAETSHSLDESAIRGEEGFSRHEIVPSQERPFDAADMRHDYNRVMGLLDGLLVSNGRVRITAAQLLKSRVDGTTLEELAAAHGVAREWIRQLEEKALRMAREHLGLPPSRMSMSGN